MAAYTWPPSLPQFVRKDFSQANGRLILVSPMDQGVAKMRRLGDKADQMKVGFYMTPAQVATLETFINTTIKATARFNFPHPRLGTVEVRIVPTQDGTLYTQTYYSALEDSIDMTLEILP